MWGKLAAFRRDRRVAWHNRSDTFESSASDFTLATLSQLTNASFARALGRKGGVKGGGAAKWCDESHLHCRRYYINQTVGRDGLFWFAHKPPRPWLEFGYGLRPIPPGSARCSPPAATYAKLHVGADCCLRDRGVTGQAQGVLHQSTPGYTGGDVTICARLCARLGCAAFSHSLEWHKCVFCETAQCPFATAPGRTRWAHRSTVWQKRVV